MSERDMLATFFPELAGEQLEAISALPALYEEWNAKINLISRRDISNVMPRHIVHSLCILKVKAFRDGDRVLDFGTGGGFPGIPLAAACPHVHFHLIDSVGKKVRAVESVAQDAGLKNVTCEQIRGEELTGRYDFVVSRAVSDLSQLWRWTRHLLRYEAGREPANGLFALKGGQLSPEVSPFGKRVKVWNLSDWISDPYYTEKRLIFVPALEK